MATTEPLAVRKRHRRQRACINCNERKVKCDLAKPCSECLKKSLDCVYVTPTIATLNKTALKEVANRMSVEMAIYKQLEVFWRNLTQSAWAGNLTRKSPQVENYMTNSLGMDLDDQSTLQTLAALFMFSRCAEILLPQYTANFDGTAAKHYWQLLTNPIHFDLSVDFEDQSFADQKRASGIAVTSPNTKLPTHATQDAVHSPVFSPSPTEEAQRPKRSPSTFSGPTSPTSNCSHSTQPHSSNSPEFVFPPYQCQPKSYDHKVDGKLVGVNGRLFDPLDDFMRVKFTSATDLINLLEYGVAFLIGMIVMEREEIVKHLGLNCRRILNDLIVLRKDQLTSELAARLVNCATIMSFYFAATSQWGVLNSVLLFAHSISLEHKLHESEPLITSRVYLILLWYTRTQGEREYYLRICRSYFPCENGIDFRCEFSYISSALRSQSAYEPCLETKETPYAYWERVAGYLDDCDRTFELLDKFGLAEHSLLYFKSLSCVMRAELGPRLGHGEWPIEQGLLLQKHIAGLSDIHTMAAISQLKFFCNDVGPKSPVFIFRGKKITVSAYILSVLDQISVAPLSAPTSEVLSYGSKMPTYVMPGKEEDPGMRYTSSQRAKKAQSMES